MIFEYLLVISPDDEINENVMQFKILFNKKYNCTHSANLKPHLTLASFLQSDRIEEKLTNGLTNISKSYSPFLITLNKIEGFDSHTIHISVINKKDLIKIANELRTRFRKLCRFDSKHEPYFATNPHITIAKNMTELQYKAALDDWKDHIIDKSFKAPTMSLLKRHIGGFYNEVAKFHFTGETLPPLQLLLNL